MAAALGAILGAAGGAASSGMASAAQYQASKHERNVAWRRQQAWELMAPGLRVAGLKAAGLNPILAATQGMTQGGTNVAMGDPGGAPHFESDLGVGRAIASVKQAKAMDSQIKILKEQHEQEREHTRMLKTEADIQSEFGRAQAATEQARREANLLVENELLLNTLAERDLAKARRGESDAAAARLRMDRMLMQMGVPGARAIEEMYEKHPWLRQVKELSSGGLIQSGVGLGSAAAIGAGGYVAGKYRDAKEKAASHFGELTPGKKRKR